MRRLNGYLTEHRLSELCITELYIVFSILAGYYKCHPRAGDRLLQRVTTESGKESVLPAMKWVSENSPSSDIKSSTQRRIVCSFLCRILPTATAVSVFLTPNMAQGSHQKFYKRVVTKHILYNHVQMLKV